MQQVPRTEAGWCAPPDRRPCTGGMRLVRRCAALWKPMPNAIVRLLAAGVAALTLAPGRAAQRFTGVITDDMCAGVGHARMRMGPTDAECTKACISAHGAAYVLEAG